MPQISVIIPAYKTQQYVERCIYSVLGQTLNNIEIIVVNDSSPDNTLSIIEQIASTWSGNKTIRIISHERNQGLSAARNTGITHAQAEFIYFLDSDDYIAPNALETLLKLAQAEDAPVTIGGVLQVDEEDRPLDHQICHMQNTLHFLPLGLLQTLHFIRRFEVSDCVLFHLIAWFCYALCYTSTSRCIANDQNHIHTYNYGWNHQTKEYLVRLLPRKRQTQGTYYRHQYLPRRASG